MNDKVSSMNLLDEETLNNIAESAWEKFWTLFTNFCTASAGFIGIIIIIRGIKLIADTLIDGYALHRVFGWSIHFLGALWDSVTNLLLHLGKPKANTEKKKNQRWNYKTETLQLHNKEYKHHCTQDSLI